MPTFPIDYTLPTDLIAQQPCEPRDHARLLVARRPDLSLHHHHFFDLPNLLEPGDLLVLNDTRVVPARLLGKRASTGGKWEGLFLREMPNACWELLCQTRGSLREGEIVEVAPGPLSLRLQEKTPDGRWLAHPLSSGTTLELLERHGQIPLPPYIRKGVAGDTDRERYQTIYAKSAGAVAAPTAGLHFTERVFADLKSRGIGWTTVTLHVGLGTFQPIQVDDYTQYPMHREWGQLSQPSADAIADAKSRGKRVVAVGTTSVRVLESAARLGPSQAWSGDTELFIHPPYAFQIVDTLITNFHLPRTTLLLLVAALAGVELTQKAYTLAIAERYRFYSYGDAMLIV
ncbi:MAG: tRNA preQ1(34) S-adenosylmethionine ribosyltransferase-isomerase QueA [Gemmataceae bacterium]|nr:tRNA preQ1(34) S-adenosylmethionine ribosyltransferase-isomerase QueA [Gemmataceae bacterium]